MSRDAVREIPARSEQEPESRQIMVTNGYVSLEGYDLTPEEIDAAQCWDLPPLRRWPDWRLKGGPKRATERQRGERHGAADLPRHRRSAQ